MGTYQDRPWLGRYESGLPGEIAPRFADALEMFTAAVELGADRPFIHYFGTTITFGAADAADCKLAMRGQNDFVSVPVASSDGRSCAIQAIILRAQGIQ